MISELALSCTLKARERRYLGNLDQPKMDLGYGAGHLKAEDPPCQRPVALEQVN